jgi:hypothetical protein
MADDHPNGYLKFSRRPIGKRNPQERIRDYNEDGIYLYQRGDYRSAGESFRARSTTSPASVW